MAEHDDPIPDELFENVAVLADYLQDEALAKMNLTARACSVVQTRLGLTFMFGPRILARLAMVHAAPKISDPMVLALRAKVEPFAGLELQGWSLRPTGHGRCYSDDFDSLADYLKVLGANPPEKLSDAIGYAILAHRAGDLAGVVVLLEHAQRLEITACSSGDVSLSWGQTLLLSDSWRRDTL